MSSVILLVADGARPDALARAMAAGELPAMAQLRAEGALHTVTSSFPSVTGPAYVPFLMGVHPGSAGLPGLRWYDRSGQAGGIASARSYVGIEMRHVDRDLDPSAPTLFERAPSSLGALSVIGRGLPRANRIGRGALNVLRTAFTHFRGDVRGWLDMDRRVGDQLIQRVRTQRPAFTFAAFTGIDKTSHAVGHDHDVVRDAMKIVDDVVARLRVDAEHRGTWEYTHLWVVSDHGHSPVEQHDDLAEYVATQGHRVLAHPRVWIRDPEVAVMVSGNAMAHVYFDVTHRTRPFWPVLQERWAPLLAKLMARPSVDLAIVPTRARACDVYSATRGLATLSWTDTHLSYRCVSGDPLQIGDLPTVRSEDAYAATIHGEYPDALVQIARLCSSSRCGDVILSAARGWDFRARYEPIPHVSSHGALHREHMLVPLLTNHPTRTPPRRTVDLAPSAARILGVALGETEGESFF